MQNGCFVLNLTGYRAIPHVGARCYREQASIEAVKAPRTSEALPEEAAELFGMNASDRPVDVVETQALPG